VHISGDSTLDPQVITRIAGLVNEPGLPADVIRSRLLDTNLFSAVEVSRSGEEVTIDLQQKVTWFVIPYFSSDPGGTYYSLVAGKAILVHEDVFTFARYQVGTNDHEGELGLKGRNILASPWDAGLNLAYQNSLNWVYSGREITQRLGNRFHGGSLEVGYRLSLNWKVSLTNFIERHSFEAPGQGETSGFQWSHRVSLEHNQFYSIEGLGHGHVVLIYGETTNPLSDFAFYKLGAASKYSILSKGDFDWVVRPSIDYSPTLPYYQLFTLGGQTLRGFPSQQFRDRYDLAILNDIYLYNWKVWVFRPRLLLFTDWAFIQGGGRTAVGAGAQFGIRNLLLSAIQVFVGYGFNPNGYATTVSIGQKF
jgi:outer membrane protein assembly factor BamA